MSPGEENETEDQFYHWERMAVNINKEKTTGLGRAGRPEIFSLSVMFTAIYGGRIDLLFEK